MSDAALPITAKSSFGARALLIGERLSLKGLEAGERLAASPLTLRLRGGGLAVLFRYGVIALFDVAPLEQAEILRQLEPLVSQPVANHEVEQVEIRVDAEAREVIAGGAIVLGDHAVERLQVVADILSKSVVLAWYEAQVAGNFDLIEPIAAQLESTGQIGPSARQLLKHLGRALLTELKMVGRAEIVEKPDLLWENPDLERLHARLRDEYEVRERLTVLERKLEIISRTARTVLDLLENRHSLRVEWYIVLLIVVEIFLTLYELFVQRG